MAKFFEAGALAETARPVILIDGEENEPMGFGTHAVLVEMRRWHYIGSEVIACNGEFEATLPADATAFVLEARGGGVHYNINGISCSTNNSYCPEDGMRSVGVVSNLASLWVFGSDATTYAHIQYWREA